MELRDSLHGSHCIRQLLSSSSSRQSLEQAGRLKNRCDRFPILTGADYELHLIQLEVNLNT